MSITVVDDLTAQDTKPARDVQDYALDFSRELDPLADTIASAEWEAAGVDVLAQSAVAGKTVVLWLGGPGDEVGTTARVVVRVTTASVPPRRYTRTLLLAIV